MSLTAFVYFIALTVSFYSCFCSDDLLNKTKDIVEPTSSFYSYSCSDIFMPTRTRFGDFSMLLQPTAIIASSIFVWFLLHDKQLSPKGLTSILKGAPHYLSLRESSAVYTFRYPSLQATPRHKPMFLLGMNLMSSTDLFYWML